MGIGLSDNELPTPYPLRNDLKFIKNFKDLWPLVIIAAKDVFFYKKISDRSKHKKPLKTFLSNSDSKIRRIILKQDRRCIESWVKLIEKGFPLRHRSQTLARKVNVALELRNWKVNNSMLVLLAIAYIDLVSIQTLGARLI